MRQLCLVLTLFINLCAAMAAGTAGAATPSVVDQAHAAIMTVHDNEALIRELAAMQAMGQVIREKYLALRKTATVAERDALAVEWTNEYEPYDLHNTERLRELLKGRAWFRISEVGSRAANDAFLIVQHADDLALQKEVLEKMTPLLGTAELRSDTYALLYDRIALREGRPQRYGTQGSECRHGHYAIPSNIEAVATLDERRQAMGLGPMADYLKELENMYGGC